MHCSRRAGKPKGRKNNLNLYTSTPMLFDESPMLFDESPMLFDELVSPLFMVQVLLKQQNYIIQTLHIFIVHTFLFLPKYILYITIPYIIIERIGSLKNSQKAGKNSLNLYISAPMLFDKGPPVFENL